MASFSGGIQSGRAAAQFDKTTSTAFATITGISLNVQAANTYHFWGYFPCTFDATGSGKFQIAGTATVTNLAANWRSYDNPTAAGISFAFQNAFSTAFNVTAGKTDVLVLLDGTLTVNAGGTMLIQFAQLVSNNTSSVLRGAYLAGFVTT